MSLFFGYTFVMTACFFLLTGTVGYFSCQWFINIIYSSIKASNQSARQEGAPPYGLCVCVLKNSAPSGPLKTTNTCPGATPQAERARRRSLTW